MNGRRIYPNAEGYLNFEPGDYGQDKAGGWWCMTPQTIAGRFAGSLIDHTIVEHEDGTITVTPSILDPRPGGYHGYLTNGVWNS